MVRYHLQLWILSEPTKVTSKPLPLVFSLNPFLTLILQVKLTLMLQNNCHQNVLCFNFLSVLSMYRHLALISIDTTSGRHTHTHSHQQALSKAPRLSRKTQSPGNNWPDMQIHSKMEKVEQNCELINQPVKGVICVGRATRSCKNEKMKPLPLARWPHVILNM